MTIALERLATALGDRYRIERELGQGGMATVYLAEDIKHKRKVALKVLKPELAAVLGAERFVVEITTTAALQHPHILPLFDSGTADGFLYYVMPFIDGETLRAKLDRETQLGIEEAVRVATDVASALHYAHQHGVIHRDIKPENILLHEGRPMVADFGIALAVSAAAGGRMTETGLSLGTPHYMSPEQATAEKEITARSDVYSLGSVLYEMLTGSPPHTGASAQQIIMKIVTEDAAPVTKLRKAVPPNVAAAVAMSLEKMPADRFASAKAFAEALTNPSFVSMSGASGMIARVSPDWRQRATIPVLMLAGVLALTTAWGFTRSAPPERLSRYAVALPEGQRVGTTQWAPFAVAPDGSRLVYSGETGRLLIRSRERLEIVELLGTEGAFNPFFSPDGSRVGFMSGYAGSAELKVASLTGGPNITVTMGVGGPGAAWGLDGYLYFDAGGIGPLMRVLETGGVAEAVSVLDSAGGELQHNWPDPLPNGRGVLITVDRGGPGVNVKNTNDIAVIDLKTRRHRVLVRGVFSRYAASGHIVYVTAEGALMGVPFDQDRLEVTGNPVFLLDGINIRRGGGGVDLAISATGTLWYATGFSLGQREILWATRSGVVSEVEPGWTGDFGSLALSPDGRKLAVSIIDAAGEHIWVRQLDRSRGPVSKLTFERSNHSPRWHPDGIQVTYTSSYVAESDLRTVRADGSGTLEILRQDSFPVYEGNWTRDGRWLVYGGRTSSSRNVYGIRPGLDSTPVPFGSTRFNERNGSISPNGRWLLFEANPTGTYEVYVRPFPNSSASLSQVSTSGGLKPKWSRDGREIFFIGGRNELVRVPVLPGESFATGEPSTLFSLVGIWDWDISPDGQRFIVIRSRRSDESGQLVVVENFFEELRQKVGKVR